MFRKFPLHASVTTISRKGCTLLIALICSLLLTSSYTFAAPAGAAIDGKAIFAANCASCHNPLKDATGPALQGVDKRVPSMEWIHNWVHNNAAVRGSGDKYANEIYIKWNKTAMTAFPQLTNEEIDAVVGYVNSVKAPVAASSGGGATETASAADDNTWLYTGITFALLLLMLILWRVNSGLKRVAGEKEGGGVEKEIPIYRNKLAIAISVILVLIFAGYWMVNGAVNMGRQQNYQPVQPIYYSHAVHAGINQINCLYCHAGSEKSRQAMIPSSNVCMNCHKQINSYTGEEAHPLPTRDDGTKINGTEEIQKLYAYAGWDAKKKDYRRDAAGGILATPIKWTKIHNLPDHVYFNHSQHVKVGQVPCQRCHGPIQEMDEVYQFSPLSMGWCINCHRQTQVKFTENNYYSIYEKYHKELKDGKREGVTVEDIGGIECQKCHY